MTPLSVRSILPEVFEPVCRQFRIADGVLNVLVAEVELNRARILAGVGEIKPGRVAQQCGCTGNSMPAAFAPSATT